MITLYLIYRFRRFIMEYKKRRTADTIPYQRYSS